MSIINRIKKNALIFILIGTTIPAIPAAFGTYILFDKSSNSAMNRSGGNYLLILSLLGFALYFGYIITFITKIHSRILWSFSFLYNLVLSLFLGYWVLYAMLDVITNFGFESLIFFGFSVFSFIWLLFVTISSANYFFNPKSFESNKSNLP